MKLTGIRRLMGIAVVAAVSLGLRLAAGDKDAWIVPEEAKKLKNPIPVTTAGLSAARDLYKDKCAKCHGETGKGDGVEAPMYSVKAKDFTDASMMKDKTDGEIFYKITEGRRPMPSFKKQLADEQRWQLVNFLRTFAAKSANPDKN